ncbi:SDR family NAD(P)-dependent oxidoreductase [Reinekea marina]|uniref:SDR family NAD(P)-dependent oxidoreductase n=1 Tax=Reinekea marina TaxID=1310421 RepID=A0ABV7WVH0_9GAMM|nr:SDR family NAD(P)-dependent oxidoreductase [Reinekea marina]MDN3648911.1 SDR family NAD(P)-dependent oxidoreductase [Reinekea marina]
MTQTILITGASSGIGLQLAKDYANQGHKVIACGRDKQKLETALDDNRIDAVVFDIQDGASIESALSAYDSLDLVILNAGTCEYIDDAKKFDAQLFKRVIDTNVLGTGYCLSAVLPKLQRGSHLAIVSSTVTFLPLTRSEAYGASKAALDYLARTLAIDLAEFGIDVSLVRPGFVETPLTDKNTFKMPGRISVQRASEMIRQGLHKRKKIINFPFVFQAIMRLLALLPNAVWHRIAVRMN